MQDQAQEEEQQESYRNVESYRQIDSYRPGDLDNQQDDNFNNSFYRNQTDEDLIQESNEMPLVSNEPTYAHI